MTVVGQGRLKAALFGAGAALLGVASVELVLRSGFSPFSPIGVPGIASIAAGALAGPAALAGGGAVVAAYYLLNAAYPERFAQFFSGYWPSISWSCALLVLGMLAVLLRARLRRAENAAIYAAAQREGDARLRLIADNVPALVAYVDAGERYRFNNRVYEEWLGRSPESIAGCTVREVWGEERYAMLKPNIDRALAGERVSLEYAVSQRGVERQVMASYVPDVDAGKVRGFFLLASDVTPLATARSELHAARERLETALDGSSVALWDTDLRTGRVYLSEAWSAILGAPRGETVTTTDALLALLHPDDVEPVRRVSREALKGERAAYAVEHRVRAGSGEWRWILSRGRVTERASGRALRMIGTNLDITDRKRVEEAMHSIAQSDALTGVANRALFSDRLRLAVARAQRHGTRLAVLYLDIDHFKQVNDSLGHAAGDALLKEVARRLRACVRVTDTVARFGGDEFVILLDELRDRDSATRIAEKILHEMRAPASADGHAVQVTTSIGIAYGRGEDEDDALVRRADGALYQAKKSGRDAFRVAEPTC